MVRLVRPRVRVGKGFPAVIVIIHSRRDGKNLPDFRPSLSTASFKTRWSLRSRLGRVVLPGSNVLKNLPNIISYRRHKSNPRGRWIKPKPVVRVFPFLFDHR